jgi:hypothetical protein
VRDERNDRRAPENCEEERNRRTVGALQTPRQNRGSEQVTGKDERKLGGEKPAFPEQAGSRRRPASPTRFQPRPNGSPRSCGKSDIHRGIDIVSWTGRPNPPGAQAPPSSSATMTTNVGLLGAAVLLLPAAAVFGRRRRRGSGR